MKLADHGLLAEDEASIHLQASGAMVRMGKAVYCILAIVGEFLSSQCRNPCKTTPSVRVS